MNKNWKIFLLVAFIWIGGAGISFAQIIGNFDKIGETPKKHTLDVVEFEEFINFSCPHCNNFRKLSKPLFKKYGARIKSRNVPILFRGQRDYPLRLYFIAERNGIADQVKQLIFDTAFAPNIFEKKNIYERSVVIEIARKAFMGPEYLREEMAPWVTKKILDAEIRSRRVGVTGTPTIVLNNSIRLSPKTGMQIFVNNLDRIIGQLLKKES